MNGLNWIETNGFHYGYLPKKIHPQYSALVYLKQAKRPRPQTNAPWFVWIVPDLTKESARNVQLANCHSLWEAMQVAEIELQRCTGKVVGATNTVEIQS